MYFNATCTIITAMESLITLPLGWRLGYLEWI